MSSILMKTTKKREGDKIMRFIDIPCKYNESNNFKVVLQEPLYTDKEIKNIATEHKEFMKGLREEYRSHVKIGKIVTTFDLKHIENNTNELFFVIGFQLEINNKEHVVALMDSNFKTFLTNIDHVVVKEDLTIDDMFPPEKIIYIIRDLK